MKLRINFTVFILIIVIIFISCKKESENTQASLRPKTVKARVIEYGSDLPVVGAILSVCTTAFYSGISYECAGNYLNFQTNSNGECFFKTDGIYRFNDTIGILKAGYHNLDEPGSICLFEDNTPYSPGQTNAADSFTVRKVPITYATVRLKSIFPYVFPVMFSRKAILSSRLPGLQNLECRYGTGASISLRVGTDTTFQYLVYGNADNEFVISLNYDATTETPIGVIMRAVRYIPGSGATTVDIVF